MPPLPENTVQAEYRKLPAIDALLRDPHIAHIAAEYGHREVTAALRDLLAAARQQIASGSPAPSPDHWIAALDAAMAERSQPSLRPVINATGVIVHTNLGRAPLSRAARAAVEQIAAGYSNLEYDLNAGSRGSRHDHARAALVALSGAQDALIVNNNAAAIYLVLTGLCRGRDVLISRGQLVEIGGGFRIPDVLRQSGAHLVEVGTTNRTHLRDYAAALSPTTAAIMRVHSSNFRQIGFVTQPDLADMANLAHAYTPDDPAQASHSPVLLIDDLGSGSFLDTAPFGLMREPMVQESLAAGADIVTFSGDKLLGGPQAGLIVGRADLIAQLRRHPMARALRVDKMTLAALEATLRSYARGRALEEIPVWQMIAASPDALRSRAATWAEQVTRSGASHLAELQPDQSAVGGGSLPGETLPTWVLALAVDHPEEAAARLRHRATPIVCRIRQDRLIFDPRTVLPDQDAEVAAALTELLR